MQFDRDITINLTKVGPKLWSYNNGEARRVELAVLDYFRAQGFRGYFSEQEDYFSKLIVLCAWPIRRPWPRWQSLRSLFLTLGRMKDNFVASA